MRYSIFTRQLHSTKTLNAEQELNSFTVTMSGKFEPKTPVNLAPPKDDPISPADLAKADGMSTPPTARSCSHVATRIRYWDGAGTMRSESLMPMMRGPAN